MSILSTIIILAFIVIMLASFFSHTKDKVNDQVSKAGQKATLENLERVLKDRLSRQEKTLAEIALYPDESESGEAAWLFMDTTISGNTLVELAWMTTDSSGLLVKDWHGLPQATEFEEIVDLATKVKGVVMFGMAAQRAAIAADMRKASRDDLASEWLKAKYIDIRKQSGNLEKLLGRLYLEDEDVPVKGLDNAEARALIIYRCFEKMKTDGEIKAC